MYIDEVKKASAKAANVVPPPPTEVQKMRTNQEAKEKRTRKAKERSNIAGLVESFSPSDETKNIDYSDPRRGGAPSTSEEGSAR